MLFRSINESKAISKKTPEEKYEFLKLLQGEIQVFYALFRTKLNDEEATELNQLVSSVRSSMHSVKSVKDIKSNINNLKQSSKNIKFLFFVSRKTQTENLYNQLYTLLNGLEKLSFSKLQNAFNDIETDYSSALAGLYKDSQNLPIDGADMTIAINFNRELFTSNKAIVMAVKDFLLDTQQAEAFNDVPVYKT